MRAVSLVLRPGITPEGAETVRVIALSHEAPALRVLAAAQWPRRAPPNRIFANFTFDLLFVHAVAKIPGLVVFPDVLQAEPIVFIEAVTRFRRTVFG